MTFPASIARTLTFLGWCAIALQCDWRRCDWRMSSSAGAQPPAEDLELAVRPVRLLDFHPQPVYQLHINYRLLEEVPFPKETWEYIEPFQP